MQKRLPRCPDRGGLAFPRFAQPRVRVRESQQTHAPGQCANPATFSPKSEPPAEASALTSRPDCGTVWAKVLANSPKHARGFSGAARAGEVVPARIAAVTPAARAARPRPCIGTTSRFLVGSRPKRPRSWATLAPRLDVCQGVRPRYAGRLGRRPRRSGATLRLRLTWDRVLPSPSARTTDLSGGDDRSSCIDAADAVPADGHRSSPSLQWPATTTSRRDRRRGMAAQ